MGSPVNKVVCPKLGFTDGVATMRFLQRRFHVPRFQLARIRLFKSNF